MSLRLRSIVTGAPLAAMAFLLYSIQIGRTPLSADERHVLEQAQSISESGRDLAGRQFPLFPQVAGEHWQQPMAVYATAAMSAVAPPALASRLASAVVAAGSVGLFYVLLAQIYPRGWAPLLATTLFAVTPAVFAYARSGLDAIYPVPFVIAWLLGLHGRFSTGGVTPVAVGAFALAVGVFAQPAAPLTMGFLLLVGLAAIGRAGTRGLRPYATIAAAFALPVSIAAAWFLLNPEAYADTFGRWVIHAAHLRYPLEGLRALVNWTTLGTRLSVYWGSFDPAWLFLDAPGDMATSLRGASPLLAMTAILAAMSLVRLIRTGATPWMLTLTAGLLVVPLAASTFGEPHAIGAFLSLVPFVLLIAADGLVDWQGREGFWPRLAGAIVALLVVVECVRFYSALLSR